MNMHWWQTRGYVLLLLLVVVVVVVLKKVILCRERPTKSGLKVSPTVAMLPS